MFPQTSVQVAPATLCSLLNYLSLHHRLNELDQIASDALQAWLDKAQADGLRHNAEMVHGYQWREVFLPDGTRLRARNYEEFVYAIVQGDAIIFNGRPVSPNQFNSAVPGLTRSAWRDIFLLFPGEHQWKRARDCRRELQAASSRPPAPPASAASRAAIPAAAPGPAAHAKPPPPREWDGYERRYGYRRREDLLLD